MLQVVSPEPFVSVSVRPGFSSLSLALAVHELAFVPGSVLLDHHAESQDVVFREFALVNFPRVGEEVLAFAFELPFEEISLVEVSFKLKFSLPGFLALLEVALVPDSSEVPGFGSLSVILVFTPLSAVHRPVFINIDTETVSFAVFPLALVDVSIGVGHPPLSVEEPLLGLALVLASVSELDGA